MTTTIADLQRALGEHYKVERELGAGGMATVYLAHDPKHDRKVAIKVLRPELAAIVGGERFLKEIRTTANLQHPHILPLHDSGDANGLIYYVMPFVEGESLRQRLQREKQLPIDEALRITREIAGALDYAHRHGVVHRDIKPENILLHDGQALVADFGIALAFSRTDGGTRMTETGMSLGTPNYMSPEQAMGEKEITPRSDVYALACVLYEMLVGEPPFTGPTPQAVFARVLTDEPRAMTLQRRTIPPHVEQAVLTALAKLPADRFGSAAQFSDALTTHATGARQTWNVTRSAHVSLSNRGTLITAAVAGLVLMSVGAVASWLVRPAAAVVEPARFSIRIGPGHRLTGTPLRYPSISPDGKSIAYVGESSRGDQIYVRSLTSLEATPLAGSEGATSPLFAADGKQIRFISATADPRTISVTGGSAVKSDFNVGTMVENWNGRRFTIDSVGALVEIVGDATRMIAKPDRTAGEVGLFAAGSIDDAHLLVVAVTQAGSGSIWSVKIRNGERTLVSKAPAVMAGYSDGYVAWMQPNNQLVGAAWDGKNPVGSNIQVLAPSVYRGAGAPAQVSFSRSGSLVYEPSQNADLVRVDRSGKAEIIGDQPRRWHSPHVSPDGSRIVADITDDGRDVWLLHLPDKTLTRVTFDNDGHDPSWLPDGRNVIYASARQSGIGIRRARVDGSGKADSVLHDGPQLSAHWVTRDGKTLIVTRSATAQGSLDIGTVSLEGAAKYVPMIATTYNEEWAALSPDDKWFAYSSDESGRNEVYVRPFAGGDRIQVSVNGGVEAVWSRNGRELYYRDISTQTLVAAMISTSGDLRVVSRTPLFSVSDFETAQPHNNYDVTPDGKFVFVRNARASEFVLIQNWPELLRRGSR